MRQIYSILFITCAAIFLGCQDDSNSLSNVGYLRLAVTENGQLNTRAYDPKIMAVKIQAEDGEIVKEIDDLDEWDGEVLELPVGNYEITAFSKDYQGEPAFNSPFYYGDTTVQVKAATETTAKVNCKIANVKVTVNYSEEFKTTFAGRDIFVTVGSAEENSSLKSMVFKYGSDAALYFPSNCGPLKATLNVSNPNGGYYTLDETEDLAEPKANDHFILNYHLGNTNKGDFTVTVDPTTNAYSYTFYINMTSLTVSADYGEGANAWATFAYLEANNVQADGEVDPSTVKFNYRKKGEQEWQEITTKEFDGTYTARPTNLEDNTTYEYCLAVNGIQANMGPEFTTEEAIILPNGGFEDWCTQSAGTALGNKNTVFPCSATDYANNRFWDTSNRGANSGGEINPTNETTTSVKGKAACLKTTSVIGNLAAASLFAGDFISASLGWGGASATIHFGKSFVSRPIALHGYYKYTPETASGTNKLPAGTSLENGLDQCAIYIALMRSNEPHEVVNTNTGTFLTIDKIKNDERFIAYGEIPSGKATEGEDFVEFTIPLRYKADKINETPTHIIVVCSASKYGDYMVGGAGSTLYVDEFSLVYDGEPTIWE